MLEEAIGWDDRQAGGQFILVKDCVATSAGFLLNYFLKKVLTSAEKSSTLAPRNIQQGPPKVVFLALSAPFSHYNRICKKQGCNLTAFRESGDLVFAELFSEESTWDQKKPQNPGVSVSVSTSVSAGHEVAHTCDKLVVGVYRRLRDMAKKSSACGVEGCKGTFIMIDDLSLLEVAAGGSRAHVLDFLHYCQVLSFNSKRCSLISLIHGDIYSSTLFSSFLRELEHAADVVISVEPLSTGYATDIHGQLKVVNRTISSSTSRKMSEVPQLRLHHLLFKLTENTVQFSTAGHQF
ncbi:hypothetical protein O6H91_23G001600 [Diphasiastrum complanatum]|uniref:Uncharacterized protein n=2 Tax=Diphasiastrum complanatum TaxID=34168 RepID=A0ACC2A7G2_DIPCM|nr:hypothetical protein O6H91_23G001600 [Diphasiastrum complanatum]KAJ7513480.1 hypothetical protein O6H91_23G001600 [Diphasiastrum complanatum]